MGVLSFYYRFTSYHTHELPKFCCILRAFYEYILVFFWYINYQEITEDASKKHSTISVHFSRAGKAKVWLQLGWCRKKLLRSVWGVCFTISLANLPGGRAEGFFGHAPARNEREIEMKKDFLRDLGDSRVFRSHFGVDEMLLRLLRFVRSGYCTCKLKFNFVYFDGTARMKFFWFPELSSCSHFPTLVFRSSCCCFMAYFCDVFYCFYRFAGSWAKVFHF